MYEMGPMATFTPTELDYLTSERRLGRLATADADGRLHVVPVGMWRVNSDLGTIDITGQGTRGRRYEIDVGPCDTGRSLTPWPSFGELTSGVVAQVPTKDR